MFLFIYDVLNDSRQYWKKNYMIEYTHRFLKSFYQSEDTVNWIKIPSLDTINKAAPCTLEEFQTYYNLL